SLEEVAALLWQVPRVDVRASAGGKPARLGFATALQTLAAAAVAGPPTLGRPPAALMADGMALFGSIAASLAGAGDGPMHHRLATGWQRPGLEDLLRRALVLVADHELNASTFVARVAVSTGASLAAGGLAASATLTGPLHGRASSMVALLVGDLGREEDIAHALRD